MRTCISMAAILVFGMILGNGAHGKSLEEETPVFVEALAKQLVAKQMAKVATLDFTDLQGRPNELGRFLAEQIAVEMVMADGITVVDRANIHSVMAEHQLTVEGLVNPENAKKLGQFAGVDVLIIGNLVAMDSTFILTVKAISTETTEIAAAGRMKFDVTEDSMKNFSTVLSSSTAAADHSDPLSLRPSSQEFPGIATKRFDNLEVVFKTVDPSKYQLNRNLTSPAISCSFELYNRDLQNAMVISANASMALGTDRYLGAKLEKYRSSLIDSSGTKWLLPQGSLKGLASVMCFEYSRGLGGSGSQNNPTAVVDYVRRGKNADFGPFRMEASGKYWAGSFSTIPPGKSLRVNATFVPMVENTRELDGIKPVEAFQLEMELVVGSISSGENGEMAKDLRLETLTFDRILMPTATEKN